MGPTKTCSRGNFRPYKMQAGGAERPSFEESKTELFDKITRDFSLNARVQTLVRGPVGQKMAGLYVHRGLSPQLNEYE